MGSILDCSSEEGASAPVRPCQIGLLKVTLCPVESEPVISPNRFLDNADQVFNKIQSKTNISEERYQGRQTPNHQMCFDQKPVQKGVSGSNKTKKIQWENFTVKETLGRGSYGVVYLCVEKNREKSDKKFFAVKQIKKSLVHGKKIIQNLKNQKTIMMESTDTNFITKVNFTFQDEHHYYMAMEWAQGGDAFSLLSPGSKRRQLFRNEGEQAIRFILGCTILGLEYLHQKNIVYQDLKPENLLMFQDGYIKLTDFGFSKSLQFRLSGDKRNVGTPSYMAPETVLRNQCSQAVDLWALGVLAFELANFVVPFGDDILENSEKFVRMVRIGQRKRLWPNKCMSSELKDLINQLLRLDPLERLGVKGWDDVKNHIFFRRVVFNWSQLQQRKMESPLRKILKEKNSVSMDLSSQIAITQNLEAYEQLSDWSDMNNYG